MKGKFKILPIQIIERENEVVLKRGLSTMLIPDKSVLTIIKVIQKALLQHPKSIDELSGLFAGRIRSLIVHFIEHLIHKNFIIPADAEAPAYMQETSQDIFYWHFNTCQDIIAKSLNEKPWAFIGINKLTKKVIQSLFREGKSSFIVIDAPSLRNIDFFDEDHEIQDPFWKDSRLKVLAEDNFKKSSAEVGFLVATSEFGSLYLLEEWNTFAIENNIPFFPLLLQNMVGYSGPLVIKNEGACLECLKLRQNSSSPDFAEKRMTEKFAFEGQKFTAYHESMVNILAEVGTFEIIKFQSNIQWELSTYTEIDLLSSEMKRRNLLKAPRCPVCSPLKEIPLVNIHQQLTSDESWAEIEQTVGYDE